MPMDFREYPDNWREISSRIRFQRAKSRCECTGECGKDHSTMGRAEKRCRAEHGKHHPTTGSKVVLTVAHLDRRTWETDETRMRAMCQACHLAYDKPGRAVKPVENVDAAVEAEAE